MNLCEKMTPFPLKNSTRWNQVGLSYLYRGDRARAVALFLHLILREKNSPATFNNLGCVLASIGRADEARWRFSTAHAIDLKAVGFEKARGLPAYRNLLLLQRTRNIAIHETFQEPSPEDPRLALSQAEFKRSLITDFLLGGITAGLFLTLLSGIAQ